MYRPEPSPRRDASSALAAAILPGPMWQYPPGFLSRYLWWYGSAGDHWVSGPHSTWKTGWRADSSASTLRTTSPDAGSDQYTPVWYCMPTSFPWRLSWVGSISARKTASRSSSDIIEGSYPTRTVSRYPYLPEHTSM